MVTEKSSKQGSFYSVKHDHAYAAITPACRLFFRYNLPKMKDVTTSPNRMIRPLITDQVQSDCAATFLSGAATLEHSTISMIEQSLPT
jgi:hypothetical protein